VVAPLPKEYRAMPVFLLMPLMRAAERRRRHCYVYAIYRRCLFLATRAPYAPRGAIRVRARERRECAAAPGSAARCACALLPDMPARRCFLLVIPLMMFSRHDGTPSHTPLDVVY